MSRVGGGFKHWQRYWFEFRMGSVIDPRSDMSRYPAPGHKLCSSPESTHHSSRDDEFQIKLFNFPFESKYFQGIQKESYIHIPM